MRPGTDPLLQRAGAALDRLAGDVSRLGIALSGGGDSLALLHLAQPWAAGRGVRLEAVIVDHGLRAASQAEAEAAAAAAQSIGVPATILHWQGRPAQGNLMQAARAARLALIAGWAQARGIGAVALGHNRDDLAETLLMRLARGAGLDGLAAMAEARQEAGILWLRPLLDCGRAELRDWLAAQGIPWADDPTNHDPAFDRARIRATMAGLGLDPAMLARSAHNLAQAHDALIPATLALVEGARAEAGNLWLSLSPLAHAPTELRRRVLVTALAWVTGATHPPRQSGLDAAWDALAAGRRTTLAGVILTPRNGLLHLTREPAAAARATPLTQAGIWDRRFRLPAPAAGQHIAARPGGADPALWQGAQHLGPAPATPLRDLAAFRAMLSAPRHGRDRDPIAAP